MLHSSLLHSIINYQLTMW